MKDSWKLHHRGFRKYWWTSSIPLVCADQFIGCLFNGHTFVQKFPVHWQYKICHFFPANNCAELASKRKLPATVKIEKPYSSPCNLPPSVLPLVYRFFLAFTSCMSIPKPHPIHGRGIDTLPWATCRLVHDLQKNLQKDASIPPNFGALPSDPLILTSFASPTVGWLS